jgi:anaerobic magnesium-protoporphyrin IX monomethyl ester cyclase
MARVLLVNPPFYRLLGSHYNGLCLGLAYIAAALNRAGHDAWVYNADFDPDPKYKTLHGIFEDFRGFDEAPVVECIEKIVAFQPDWVGYSCYTAVIPALQQITEGVHRHLPNAWQVVGGPHPTLDHHTGSLFPSVDYIVQGEGEVAMLHLVEGFSPMQRTIPIERITHLDALDFPERKKFWLGTGRDVSYLSTARGCPWRCAYCASPSIWPRVYSRSPESVLREIATLPVPKDTLVPASHDGELFIQENSCLYIIDDTFTWNEKRALAIMAGMAGIPWKCEARADTITPEIAEGMARSNCKRVKMGVESGSDRILASMNKGETKSEILAAVRLLQYHRVPITLYLMAGFPGETNADLQQTIDFARELHADYYSISMLAPYYGTRIYRDALAAGLPVDKAPWSCFFHHNDSLLVNPNLSRDLIEDLWSLCDVRKYV